MSYYPLMIQLADRPVLLVGGGRVARRKADALLSAGAALQVVAPVLCDRLAELAAGGAITWRQGVFAPADLEGIFLAVACTDRREVNARIGALCRERGVLCCLCDDAEQSDAIFPAVVKRGAFQLAVSTGGQNPGLAREVKKRLSHQFGPEYAALCQESGQARQAILRAAQGAEREALLRQLDAAALEGTGLPAEED
ncbi:precorrin-2 dehydrogenase/sirohydrochlorin ferrochelatase family protein [Bittarella massiliensis (ex Durand et al. 2017)]|uniref:precorrin-2 dehydrogenase/sirohydrochlorin ferrochelatase family protein n=1 Tax=Bittarella massiliensis (ex Durand et al. 2017) TaxID=1720313 RepID=UPI00073EA6BD|nr:bifunctional precorrin-2 dehydrogenase/sirohydrochlorin ferrochelatase [Bittarella massiliensis (ex Durand et al. 2017)]